MWHHSRPVMLMLSQSQNDGPECLVWRAQLCPDTQTPQETRAAGGPQEPPESCHWRKVTKTLAPEPAAMLWKGRPDIWMFFLRRTGFSSPENMLLTRVRQEGVQGTADSPPVDGRPFALQVPLQEVDEPPTLVCSPPCSSSPYLRSPNNSIPSKEQHVDRQ